jgi:hypothetical protein
MHIFKKGVIGLWHGLSGVVLVHKCEILNSVKFLVPPKGNKEKRKEGRKEGREEGKREGEKEGRRRGREEGRKEERKREKLY